MPALTLSDEEAARVKLGLCACGCGESLPATVETWGGRKRVANGRRTAQNRCRKRLLRRRRGEGRSISRPERARLAKVAEADKLLAEAREEERKARSSLQWAASKRHKAQRLLVEANESRQVAIPFIEATGPDGQAWLEGKPVSSTKARKNRRALGITTRRAKASA